MTAAGLEIKDIQVRYSRLPVIHGVSISVRRGETVCIIGGNGSGKSTILRAVMGAQPPFSGRILFDGQQINGFRTEDIVRLGLVYVPEEKMLFRPLSVEENLLLGAYTVSDPIRVSRNLDLVYELFPKLRERRKQAAATLSGGEQQMAVIGRGLISNPKLLMLDEPSLGLSPLLVDELFDTISKLKAEGLTILLVEQNVREALDLCDRGYVLQTGKIVEAGTGEELLASDNVKKAFLGL
ncbi:MAG: ABC transporter ATP-binding protein [Syntrophobacteraceae bacterium]